MPLFHYACEACGKPTSKFRKDAAQAKKPGPCSCGGKLKRNATPMTTQVMETLDNGVMPRQVTRLADAERIFTERAHKRDE